MNKTESGLSLESLEKLHGDELAKISHALKTPLTSIIGFASAILNDPDMSRETSVEFSKIIIAEGERLSRFVDELLYISFGDTNPAREGKDLVDPAALVQTALRIVSAKVNQPSSRFEVHLDGFPLTVALEKEFAIKMLCNVFNNAARFSAHHSPVIIKGSMGANCMVLQVISRRHGFNLDLRTSGTRTPGDLEAIGLARTKYMLSLHGGDMTVNTVDHNKTAITLVFSLNSIREYAA